MRKQFVILVYLLLLSSAVHAFTNQLEYSLGHGYPKTSVSAGEGSGNAGGTGTDWNADILHVMNPRFYLGLGGGMFRSGDATTTGFLSGAQSTLSSRTSSILALARMDWPSPSRLVPYLIGGAGWVRSSLNIRAAPSSPWTDTGTSEIRMLLDDSQSTFGYAGGAGLDYTLTQALVFGVEVRYQGSLKKSYALTAQGAAATGLSSIDTSLDVLTATLKIGIKY